jgi:cysteine desulfurase / selenocysteine lyase
MSAIAEPAEVWDRFRQQMPVSRRWAYFDHAAVAPLSQPAQGAMMAWLADIADNGDVAWRSWADQVEQCRVLGARLLNASQDEIALVRNTTEGVSLIAEGFPWLAGDNVVVPACEFPTNLYPWLNLADRGVEVRLLAADGGRIDLDRLAERCDARTRIVALSWIGYATGWRVDLRSAAEIAHRHGGLLFVDAIQGLGAIPLDVAATSIDFCAADGHKWLLGPEGAGLLYVRREHLPRLRPLGVGWNSVRQAGHFDNSTYDLKPVAARYEGGSYPMACFIGLAASLRLLLELGTSAVADRIGRLTDVAMRRLEAAGASVIGPRRDAERGGIVAFELPGRGPMEVRRACLARGVALSCRGGRLRISPHAYNNEQDIDRLVESLSS